jgi:manganese/iron transport system permease protein
VKAVGTVLVIALLIVPAATARLLSDRLVVIVPASVAVAAFAGWIGLSVSFSASVDHGVRLAAGATVVLVLVGCYLVAVLALAVRRRLPRPSTVDVPA